MGFCPNFASYDGGKETYPGTKISFLRMLSVIRPMKPNFPVTKSLCICMEGIAIARFPRAENAAVHLRGRYGIWTSGLPPRLDLNIVALK